MNHIRPWHVFLAIALAGGSVYTVTSSWWVVVGVLGFTLGLPFSLPSFGSLPAGQAARRLLPGIIAFVIAFPLVVLSTVALLGNGRFEILCDTTPPFVFLPAACTGLLIYLLKKLGLDRLAGGDGRN